MTFTSLGTDNAFAPLGASPQLSRAGQESAPGKTRSSKDEPYSAEEPPRILIVEDVLLVAWHLESLLIELGYEVCGLASDGRDAIEQASDAGANVLLMDVNLGEGIDGIEAARRIRETTPAAVVFVTAYNSPSYLERIEKAFPGAPVLDKPVTKERLRTAITTARKLEAA